MIARRRLLCDHEKTNDSRWRVSRIRDGREPATLIKDARLSERGKGLEGTPRELSKSKDFQNGMWFLSPVIVARAEKLS